MTNNSTSSSKSKIRNEKVPEGISYFFNKDLMIEAFPMLKKFKRDRLHFGIEFFDDNENPDEPSFIITVWDKQYD